VDEPSPEGPAQCWFGAVVPKRHARKATTRNLLRRQIRAAMDRHHQSLAHGLWLVRLRAPFDAAQYRSAGSMRLRDAARTELDGLLTRATA
jgi:ribonuclease P protein component